MVNSVAVERQAISRRGERESSGGGKKERKGRKKERKDGLFRPVPRRESESEGQERQGAGRASRRLRDLRIPATALPPF